MVNQRYILCLTVVCFTLIIPDSILGHGQTSKSMEQQHMKLLFVFGDSLFDVGNNQYIDVVETKGGYYWPYGISFHNQSTGRICDGLLVPDLIAQIAELPITQPYLQPGVSFKYGANFASAGSTVLNYSSATNVMNLRTQLSCFKNVVELLNQKLGEELAKNVLMSSVFLISTGGNDYLDFGKQNLDATESEHDEFIRMVLGNTTDVLKELYELGGRKFAFQNVGPMGCYAYVKQTYSLDGKCVMNISALAILHNMALSNALKKLEMKLPGFKFSIFDYYHALLDRIDNPSKYGFKEGRIACCGEGAFKGEDCEASNVCTDPSEYVLFDGMHHTEKTNRQLAQLLWSGTGNVTGPYNVKQLFEMQNVVTEDYRYYNYV